MLKPYKYPKSEIQKLQSFVNYIMLEIVLRARKMPNATFSVDLLISKYSDIISKINSRYLFDPISRMFLDAKKLDRVHLKMLRKAVLENNRIEELCKGYFSPIKYEYLKTVFTKDFEKDMLNNIKIFCVSLYDNCLKLAPVYKTYGKIKDYHDSLVLNDDRCHICGEDSLLTQYETARNAFDHYLAKQTYPFVSVNFKNLLPSCHNCNSSYKKSTDILYYRGKRILAFYPYTKEEYIIRVNVKFKLGKVYSPNITPEDFDLDLISEEHQEQVDNWKRVYKIESRYKAKCCSDTFKSCLKDIVDNIKLRNMSTDETLRYFENNMDYDMNFLKVPFFRAALSTIIS